MHPRYDTQIPRRSIATRVQEIGQTQWEGVRRRRCLRQGPLVSRCVDALVAILNPPRSSLALHLSLGQLAKI